MDFKEERILKLISLDVIIEKSKEDNPEILQNDFDNNIFLIKKKNKPKKIIKLILLLILILILIIIGIIIFIIVYLNKEKSSCIIGEEEKCRTCKEDINECLTCNPGYFIPDDEEKIKNECQNCPMQIVAFAVEQGFQIHAIHANFT